MAEMASEQITQAERDGRSGLTPSAIDDSDRAPNSPVTAGELEILLDTDNAETNVVTQSATLEQTGIADTGEVYQAVASLTLRSPNAEQVPDSDMMQPPVSGLKVKKAATQIASNAESSRPELTPDEQIELEKLSVKVGDDSKAVYVDQYLLEGLGEDGKPFALDPFIAEAIRANAQNHCWLCSVASQSCF